MFLLTFVIHQEPAGWIEVHRSEVNLNVSSLYLEDFQPRQALAADACPFDVALHNCQRVYITFHVLFAHHLAQNPQGIERIQVGYCRHHLGGRTQVQVEDFQEDDLPFQRRDGPSALAQLRVEQRKAR